MIRRTKDGVISDQLPEHTSGGVSGLSLARKHRAGLDRLGALNLRQEEVQDLLLLQVSWLKNGMVGQIMKR